MKGDRLGQQRNSTRLKQQGAFAKIEGTALDRPGLLKRLYTRLFRRSDLDNLQKLKEYLERSAAYLTHENVLEYFRSRAGVRWMRLQSERKFHQVLEVSQWKTFVIGVELVGEMALIVLRNKCRTDPQDLAGMLGQLLREVLMEHAQFKTSPKEEWHSAVSTIQAKLRTVALVSPKSIPVLAATHTSNVFACLPVHNHLHAHDGCDCKTISN